MTVAIRPHRGHALAVLLALASSCGSSPSSSAPVPAVSMTTPDVASDLQTIRQSRVYFYHHSVGVNLLAGVERLDAETGGGALRLEWIDKSPPPLGPALIHGGGAQNRDPRGKIEFFASTVRKNTLDPSLAFMKLCYVDIDPSTDVGALFSLYRDTIEQLKREHPGVRFGHVTVPLRTKPTDLKSSLRRLAGLQVWDDAANVKRAEYNRLLRTTFTSDPVFDLAAVEATGPDGTACTFEDGGREFPCLHSAYAEGGGHLNALGQRVAGEAAIRFMAQALRTRTTMR